ncbi:hypothetical protein KAFR_0B00530 [Kazachstania africana CBS 2517]|uniref:Choline/carnitine acyltransferase domain-containing protein n=1 Tax=Kazachstania africana (strain ATCC 22294 / BCRC 22015 / CBS 2517 / CECT 1963 / NBRC 1671 / NRRL Y-8276) TaxID=1071382 RepID=H2APQ2_KAZAF|nr:hypothetical protein KAFR_0B00530 [Kazachstania africana CBS 2517]CCF56352.1 hypothetical protein KAFR_0B00530 [Kazachstania africana CBS 2517]
MECYTEFDDSDDWVKNGGDTFEFEDSLPKLPLPDLRDTLTYLKKSLEPLYYADGYYKHPLDPRQIKALDEILSNFEKSIASRKLHAKLAHYHETENSYLDKLHLDINNHTSTREVHDDILPRNPFLILSDDPLTDIPQADRAAVLVHSSLRFTSALRKYALPPDVNPNTGNHLTMHPYLNLFGTTRCPVFQNGEIEGFDINKPYSSSDIEDEESDQDETERDPATSDDNSHVTSDLEDEDEDMFSRHGITIKRHPETRHILIISKGQYYTLDVFDDENDILYSYTELTSFFNHILKDSVECYNFSKSTALGSLTSHSFKNWKYARKRLQKRYPQELHLIDSALFVLVLDESTNTNGDLDQSEDCKRLFYGSSVINEKGYQVGSCVSRWYDKLQLVVTSDSKAAVIWDSFTCDGSVALRFTSEIYTESILRLAKEVNSNDPRFSLWPTVRQSSISTRDVISNPFNYVNKIEWSFTNILNTHVHLSETKLADLISKHDIIKASIPIGRRSAVRLGVKPDSMVQVALQIAHYSLYGKMIFTLEPISTRGFKNSRSCFVNVQNQELLELCQLFISNCIDEQGKLDKFIQACENHSNHVKLAKKGLGYDKHFNALRYLFKFHNHFGIEMNAQEAKVASDLFENPLISPFSQPELIAANCGNAATTAFGITPAVPQGFGVGYIIKDDHVDLSVTSQFRQGNRLIFMLNWVLNEIRAYWRVSRSGKASVKISPLVDRLYELDNSLRNKKMDESARISITRSHSFNNGLGFFDIDAHIDSRSISATPPIISHNKALNKDSTPRSYLSSSTKLSTRITELAMNSIDNHSSAALSVPTEKEKQDTGLQILQVQPTKAENTSEEEEDEDDLLFNISRPTSRRRSINVVDSKFEIDFDRAYVGRKVSTLE